MIWQYFPIAFRFPVNDASIETKRACWEVALSALCACEAEGVTLYDAQQSYDAGSDSPVYMCIACYYGIKQARLSAKLLYALDGLMTHLVVHQPFLQANALESFGPYPLLGTFRKDGTVAATEEGEALFANLSVVPMRRNEGIRLLIASEDEEEGPAQNRLRVLGIEAAKTGFCVRRLPIANGGAGTVRALVSGMNGRFESVTVCDGGGERKNALIGVLPGRIAAIESCGQDAATVGALILKALDFGYRRIRIGTGGCIDPQNALLAAEALGFRFFDEAGEPVRPDAEHVHRIARVDSTGLDPRFSACECIALSASQTQDDAHIAALLHIEPKHDLLLCALSAIGFQTADGAEAVFGAINFEAAVRQSDFVVLNPSRMTGETARCALLELNAQKKPTCLIGTGACDAELLMRENPVLRGAVRVDAPDEDAQKRAFCAEVLPMIGKDVAKTSRL